MRTILKIVGLLLTVLITACGGGGGSAGNVGGSTSTGSTGSTGSTLAGATPTLVIQAFDLSNNAVSNITPNGANYVKATLKSSTGAAVADRLVTFTVTGPAIASLSSSTALTNASGEAQVAISPLPGTAGGATTVSAQAVENTVSITKSVDLSVAAANGSFPTLAIQILNSANTAALNVTPNSGSFVKATLKNSTGVPIAGRLVTFTLGGPTIALLSSSTALTNASGEAQVAITPVPGTTGGAATVSVQAVEGTADVANRIDFSVPAAGGLSSVPTLTLGLRDSGNLQTTSVSGGGVSIATARLLDADGKAIANRLVNFSAAATLVKLNPSSGGVLTDANGVASIQVSAVSLEVSGASTIRATAQVGAATYSGAFDYQVSATNLALRSLNVGSSALAAYGNRAISVQVTANGLPVSTPIQVSFVASCGSITATANTDANGIASATYKADVQSCAGTNVNISASAVGATVLFGQIAVQSTAATNIQFLSTAPALIFLRDSGAATQALVSFKVIDSNGNPQQNQAVALSFVNAAPGVTIDTIGNTAVVTKTSDAAGVFSVAVFSGTVPTPVQVRATLAANPLVTTTSGVLTVATGRPVQRAASIASVKLSLEGFNFDGDTTPVTLSIADRQGNPVPDGTVVNFVSQSGVMIPPTCVITGGTSQCSSSIRSQGTRPENGRVSILAYVQGEEDFVDANFNNVYDAGEAFTDLGNAYRSDINGKAPPSANAISSNWSYLAGEFSVPRGDTSAFVTCTGAESGRPNTCDGKWGAVDVRKQHLVIFATTIAAISASSPTTGNISFSLSDLNGNSMPTGSVAEAAKVAGSDPCTVKAVSPSLIANSYDPALVVINLDKCSRGDIIRFKVTTPVTKTATAFDFTLP